MCAALVETGLLDTASPGLDVCEERFASVFVGKRAPSEDRREREKRNALAVISTHTKSRVFS